MHLPVKVIGEAPVVIETAEVGAADVADLELLVARGARGVGELLELALALGFGLAGLVDAVHLVDGFVDFADFAEDFDFEEAVIYARGKFGYSFKL